MYKDLHVSRGKARVLQHSTCFQQKRSSWKLEYRKSDSFEASGRKVKSFCLVSEISDILHGAAAFWLSFVFFSKWSMWIWICEMWIYEMDPCLWFFKINSTFPAERDRIEYDIENLREVGFSVSDGTKTRGGRFEDKKNCSLFFFQNKLWGWRIFDFRIFHHFQPSWDDHNSDVVVFRNHHDEKDNPSPFYLDHFFHLGSCDVSPVAIFGLHAGGPASSTALEIRVHHAMDLFTAETAVVSKSGTPGKTNGCRSSRLDQRKTAAVTWWLVSHSFFKFSPRTFGEMIQFDFRIFFQMGWWKTTNQVTYTTEKSYPTSSTLEEGTTWWSGRADVGWNAGSQSTLWWAL